MLLFAVGSSEPAANAAVTDLADRLAADRPAPVGPRSAPATPRAGASVLAEPAADPVAIVPLFLSPRAAAGPDPRASPVDRGWSSGRADRRTAPPRSSLAPVRRGRGPRRSTPLALRPWPSPQAHAGRRYPPTAPYEVSAAKIAEFADALGDANPAYRASAPIAPPTFVAVVSSAAWEPMFDDPELELALRRVVHGDQRFRYAAAAAGRRRGHRHA